MSATCHLAAANLKHHARRYVATTVAITLSLAFVFVALSFGNALSTSLSQAVTGMYSGASTVVSLTEEGEKAHAESLSDPDLTERLRAVEGVTTVHSVTQSHMEFSANDERTTFLTDALAPEPFARPELGLGTYPTTPTHVILDASVADTLKVTVGDTVNAKVAYSSEPYTELEVVGITTAAVSMVPRNYLSPEGLSHVAGPLLVRNILVATAENSEGVPDEQHQTLIRDRVATALQGEKDLVILTYNTAVEMAEAQIHGQGATTQATLLLFPIIAVTVALIVVASTFRVVMNQREREIALLRTLGATTRQVRRLILLEAVGIGLVSSVAAILLGMAASVGSLMGIGMSAHFFEALAHISPTHTVIVAALGVLLAVAVGIRPALGASKTRPMAALGAAADMPEARRHNVLRSLPALIFLVAAGGGVVWGLSLGAGTQRFLILLLSGVIALVSILLLLSPYFPTVARASSVLAVSPLSSMARENLMRNPGRTSATGIAIIIGVTLVSTMMIGASSLRVTLDSEVDARRPIDLKVNSVEKPLSSEALEAISSIDGVKGYVPARQVLASVSDPQTPVDQAHQPENLVLIEGQPDLNKVAHSPGELIKAGNAVIPQGYGIGDAQQVRICVGSTPSCATFTAHVPDSDTQSVLIPEADLLSLDKDAPVHAAYVSLNKERPATAVQSELLKIADDLVVEGAAIEREMYSKMIDSVLMVVLALLGVSVVVSVVGVANTLSLSVHERTRENGLLRALGLTRTQMRRLLVWEALAIAMSATLIGLTLGVGFAWLGMQALPVDVEHVIISVPWAQLGLVILVSLVSTVMASWLPSRRAARTSPIEALAAI